MLVPPTENRQFIKIDDASFYIATTSSQQINAADLAGHLRSLCESALALGVTLRAAAAAGVAKAAEIEAVLNSVEAFSNEAKAAQFLAALQAIQDG